MEQGTLGKIIWSIVFLAVGVMLYFFIKRTMGSATKKILKNDRLTKKRDSYAKLLRSLVKYAIGIVVVLLILQINGIDVTSIIAGLGIASVIAGLALQDTLKNIISGFNIVADDYFMVGDVLRVNGVEGKVIDLRLKTTKLQSIKTQDVYVISNQDIRDALIVSKQLDISISLPYEEKIDRIEKIMSEIVEKISKIEKVESASYLGLSEFSESALEYKIRLLAKPEYHPAIKLAINKIIKLTLEQKNVSIPYPQLDVHQIK